MGEDSQKEGKDFLQQHFDLSKDRYLGVVKEFIRKTEKRGG